MNQELVYTSAPRGLKPGSRGFCTVASSAGMAKNLADLLESLSPYRHVHPPNSEQSRLNPVNFSYVITRIGGKQMRIVSRVSDAGLDYSNRSNKLAHHVVVEQVQKPAGGPAWLLSQPGFVFDNWSGEPRQLSSRSLPDGNPAATVCEYWRTTTGDAGWAGELAKSLTQGKSAYIVFPPETDVLRLFREAQLLLPVQQRWECTFSTYFTKLPPNVDCLWRAVVAGGPESGLARRAHDAFVIDLSNPTGSPGENEYVTAARSGRTVEAAAGSKTTAQPDAVVPPISAQIDAPRPIDVPVSVEPWLTLAPPDIPTGGKRVRQRAKAIMNDRNIPPALTDSPVGAKTRGLFWKTAVILFIAILLIFPAGFFIGRFWNVTSDNEVVAKLPDNSSRVEHSGQGTGTDKNNKQARDKQARDKEARDKEARDKEARDKEARDKEARDKEARDKEARDKEARDKEAAKKFTLTRFEPVGAMNSMNPQSFAEIHGNLPSPLDLKLYCPIPGGLECNKRSPNPSWTISDQNRDILEIELKDRTFTRQAIGDHVNKETKALLNASLFEIEGKRIQFFDKATKPMPFAPVGPAPQVLKQYDIIDLPQEVIIGVDASFVLPPGSSRFALSSSIEALPGVLASWDVKLVPDKDKFYEGFISSPDGPGEKIGKIVFVEKKSGSTRTISCRYEFEEDAWTKSVLKFRTKQLELENSLLGEIEESLKNAKTNNERRELLKDKAIQKSLIDTLDALGSRIEPDSNRLFDQIKSVQFSGQIYGTFNENNETFRIDFLEFGDLPKLEAEPLTPPNTKIESNAVIE